MIRKVLAALDGSKTAESVMPYLETLLTCADAQVTLVRVVKSAEQHGEEAWRYLRGCAARLAEHGASVETDVLIGRPAQEIVRRAVSGRYDLVMMCTRGRTPLKRIFLGSVARDVLRRSPVPVLIVHPKEVWCGPARFRRILVPLDGSHRAAKVLPRVIDVAEAEGSDVVLLRVMPEKEGEGWPESLVSANLVEERKAILKKGLLAEIMLRRGDPAEKILELAAAEWMDLIAMATHGRTGLARLRYGSVAEAVLQKSRCPLLVVRTAAKPLSLRSRTPKLGRKTFAILRQIERAVSVGPYRGK